MSGAVITGVGVASAFGVGTRPLLAGLAEGKAAVGPIRGFDARTFPTRVAAEVPLFGDALLARLPAHDGAWDNDGRFRDRKVVFALIAAAEAWHHAKCGPDEEHAALSIAMGLEQAFVDDFLPILGPDGLDWSAEPAAPLPHVRFRSTVDLAATSVRALLALRGSMVVHVSACAAGGLAVAHAASLIARGAADVVLCGGSDSMINPLGIGGMSRIGAPSPRAEADACRPFDRRRDGLAMGEGAAMFVVEAEERARARGVRPLARVLGWGSTQDAYRVTAPRPDGAGARVAIERALERARISGRDVGYVNAHGTGTPLNDPAEALAIRGAIGDHAAVSSIKGALGHLMAASGALELAGVSAAVRAGPLTGHRAPRRARPGLRDRRDRSGAACRARRCSRQQLVRLRGPERLARPREAGVTGAVVLGWALRTPLGATVDDVVARLLAGERGEGRAIGTNATSRHGRFLSRLPLLALETAHEALARAGLTGGDRVGVFAAVGGLRVDWAELVPVLADQRDDGSDAWERGLSRIHPFWMLRNLSNNGHALLSADLGARGEGTTCGGATAGAQAISAATRALAAGVIDTAVVVAYDSLLGPEAIADLEARGLFAKGSTHGAPYGEDPGGVTPGEATAAIVLAREGRALARVVAASVADGETSEPRDSTIARVAARVCASDHGVVVDGAARARSADDAGERAALATITGTEAPLVATAGATGALGAATALVQTIVMGELLRRGMLPPIAGLSRAASGPLRPVVAAERSVMRHALCISTGAPGLAAAVRVEVVP